MSQPILFNPLDLIPDFIPIIGYPDYLLIVPGAFYPVDVMRENRETAAQAS
ncbi:DUF1232 domain-containing protein [Pantoea agglomerans]|uniref:DUF1232 domain-containing protein n=1 Tax=Enterobacter agglomerans TaxID=549 RepID=UPI003BFA74DF